jgi:hypothetical protein
MSDEDQNNHYVAHCTMEDKDTVVLKSARNKPELGDEVVNDSIQEEALIANSNDKDSMHLPIFDYFALASQTPLQHAERLQELLQLDKNQSELASSYLEVTNILLFYAVQEVNLLFSEYLDLTNRNLQDDANMFFLRCKEQPLIVPLVNNEQNTIENTHSHGITTFALTFIIAEALDYYLDNLNLPIYISILGALVIALIAEWFLQPYVKDRFK